MHTAIKKEAGQTILELLIALTLIILFLSGVSVLQVHSIKNVEFSRRKSMATKLAREQLERARVIRDSSGVDSMPLCLLSCYINSELTPIPQAPDGPFTQQLTIRDSNGTDCPVDAGGGLGTQRLYTLETRVSWQQGNVESTKESVSLSSCLRDWR